MYSLKYDKVREEEEEKATIYYYQKLAQCVKCRRLYPPSESSGNETLCVFCICDTLARKMKQEAETAY